MKNFRIKQILPVREGTSQQTGMPWKSQDVVLEDAAPTMYPDVIVARLNGEAVGRFSAREGDVVSVQLSFFAHEHDGRWFNNIVIRDLKKEAAV